MNQLALNITPPTPSTTAPTPHPDNTTPAPGGWVSTPTPLPAVGDRLVDRHGRAGTVEAVRMEVGVNMSIDVRLHVPSDLGCGTILGLFAPTWWRDWRKA